MNKLSIVVVFFLISGALYAQNYSDDLKDCNYEKDEVFIDWGDEVNQKYVEKESVVKFSKKRLRSFYCKNLVARDRIESEGFVVSKGSFQLADDDEKFLVFSIKMGDLIYQEKLFIHIGPDQKLISSKD
ncbi:hypothetical protein [Ekhidna sp.]